MANDPLPATSTEVPIVAAPSEADRREDWFVARLNPWREIVFLEPGGDRTFATTVERMVVNADTAQRPAMEAQLLVALDRRELTDAGRLFICRMLGLIGSSACVPALSALLEDNATADVARLALDSIDDAAVDTAYRAALPRLSGSAKAGLVGSIALRHDRQATETLRTIAGDPAEEREVRDMAARAVDRLSLKPR